jgi:hypothetical protein
MTTMPGRGFATDRSEWLLPHHLSTESTDDAPDDEQPRLGAWLELRADDPAAVLRATLDAGLTEVKYQATRITS